MGGQGATGFLSRSGEGWGEGWPALVGPFTPDTCAVSEPFRFEMRPSSRPSPDREKGRVAVDVEGAP